MKTDKNSRIHNPSRDSAQIERGLPDTHPANPTPPKFVRMTYDKWLAKYRPIKNPSDANAPYDGCMFEIYGADFEFVRRQPLEKIWTLLDDGDRNQAIYAGCHYVDRIGYFVTEVPCPSNRFFSIKAE